MMFSSTTTALRAAALAPVALLSSRVVDCDSAAKEKGSAASSSQQAAVASLRRRLTPIGKFSLLSETEANPSIGAVLLRLGAPISERELAAKLDATLTSYRFRSVLEEKSGDFVELSQFSARDVVNSSTTTSKDLLRLDVAERLPVPFPTDLPRWEVRVFDGGESLLMRCHHALADGVSVAALLADVSDQGHDFRAMVQKELTTRRQRRKRSWLRLVFTVIGGLFQLGIVLVRAFQATFFASRPFANSTKSGKKSGRRVAWVTDFATVDELRAVGKRGRATINDVFAAIVAGGLGAITDSKKVAAAFPIHLCGGVLPPGVDVGNHIGAVLCPLELYRDDDDQGGGDNNPADHLARVSRDVGATLRGGFAPLVSYYAAVAAVSTLPASWLPTLFKTTSSSATVALTNIRGPPLALSICGRPVIDVIPFLPPPPGVTVGCALTTVDGHASLSLNADADLDVDALLDAIIAHYSRLQRGQQQQTRKP
mmetsp:Transcript_30972/g.99932  ORF Transcript_30972/g.99932 Transcript_30972/m.99932 type:complete len:484 (-) Transcript_30972:56-1507(-)